MTDTAAAIVTALEDGPASARDLSQRLHGIGYPNIRQTLRRLSQRGIIAKASRGVYRLGHCDTAPATDRASPTLGSCHNEPARAPVHGKSTPADCDRAGCDAVTVPVVTPAIVTGPVVTPRRFCSDAQIDAAIAGAWEHFERMNDPSDPAAWE